MVTKSNHSSDVVIPAPTIAIRRGSAVHDQSTADQTSVQETSPTFEADGTVIPECGQRIGRYQVLGRVGSGGMGQVYSAHDPELQRIVAIKVHNLHPGPNSTMKKLRVRLMSEARALACISDPNVVTVFDVGLFRGQVFVAMELIRGSNLEKWIKGHRRSSRKIVEAYLGAAAGLAAAHRVGVVHKDVKPANFVFGLDGRVRVVDFGLARVDPSKGKRGTKKACIDATQTGRVIGTPAYISPEQLAGYEVDARGDQFSFCVTLWEALSGELPFAADSMEERAEAIRQGRLQGRKRIPRALRSVLEHGLSARPERRHGDMEILATRLRTALELPKRLAIAMTVVMALLVAFMLV